MSFDDLDTLLKDDASSGGKKREEKRWPILVIDDDPDIRETLGVLLDSRYQVTLAASAEEGVAAMREDTCAVVLDIKMGGKDGFWACDEIRKKVPDVPVIFFSAYQDAKDPYRIINEHRPFAYISKDGSSKKLLDTIDMAVKLQSMIISNRQFLRSLTKGRSRIP